MSMRVLVAPGNPGMTDVARVEPVDITNATGLVGLVRRESIDLVVIGPEAPLVAGLADELRAHGVAVVGPGAAAARLEGSKSFCREVAAAAGVAIARGGTFTDVPDALAFAATFDGRVAVKADGLAAGKGVSICEDLAEAATAIRACLLEGAFGAAGRTIVIEELLVGREVSVIAICDETAVLALPAARDHKRLRDGDEGPEHRRHGRHLARGRARRTRRSVAILDAVHRPILAELARRGIAVPGRAVRGSDAHRRRARGCSSATSASAIPRPRRRCRAWRRPSCRCSAASLRGDLRPLPLRPGITGSLLPVSPSAAAAVVVATAGYPELPRTGDAVGGVHGCSRFWGARVLRGRAREPPADLVSAGGRVLVVVGDGPTADDAIGAAYAGVGHIQLDGMQVRRDIGRTPPCRGNERVIPRYTLPAMADLWTEQARFEAMLRVELAVLRVLADDGIVPGTAVAAIEARGRVDVARIAELERTTDHDVIAFVSQVAETVGDEGRWLHFGLTSSDVVDTGLALQCQAAGRLLIGALDDAIEILVARAREHARTLQMGRTHSVHAEPITFGLKLASWAFELDRDRARLRRRDRRPGHGQDLGARGHLLPARTRGRGGGARGAGPGGRSGQHPDRPARPARGVPQRHRRHRRIHRALRDRGPQPPAHRDRRAPGALPTGPEGLQSRCPTSATRSCRSGSAGLARLLRGFALAGMEDQALWHERDISHSSVERVVLPGATTLLHYMLVRFRGLVADLVVRPERMLENIERGLGLHASSRLLTALVEDGGMSREDAYAVDPAHGDACGR